jgi:hypothetical protein
MGSDGRKQAVDPSRSRLTAAGATPQGGMSLPTKTTRQPLPE